MKGTKKSYRFHYVGFTISKLAIEGKSQTIYADDEETARRLTVEHLNQNKKIYPRKLTLLVCEDDKGD